MKSYIIILLVLIIIFKYKYKENYINCKFEKEDNNINEVKNLNTYENNKDDNPLQKRLKMVRKEDC